MKLETNEDVKNMLAGLRGGVPEKCDFCDQPMAFEDAVPEEGGMWACIRCWDRWEAEDLAHREELEAEERGGG